MKSKTPKFDALMDVVLGELVSHTMICAECKNEFKIESDDIVFLKMFRVPPPSLCPQCRQRRRLTFANYSNIYKRKCDVPGHTDTMISIVAPVIPWITYDYKTYYSDAWDPYTYGRGVKEGESFFDQFLDLLKVVPQPGVRRGSNSPNCDYSFYGKDMKDSYYAFGGRRSEDIMYSSSVYESKHVFDSYYLRKIDTSYENVSTSDSYKLKFAYFSSNCLDCEFIYDCRNCQNCFGCVNLRNKNYCWFNKQMTRDEFLKKRASVDLGSIKIRKEYQSKFWDFVKENPIRAVRINQSHDVSGNDISRSKNCKMCFQVDRCENLRYASFAVINLKDSMDVGFCGGAERLYDCQNCGTKSSNVKFSYAVKESIDCEYMMTCENCTNCFGCIGLENASYTIFNKKYNEKEYWEMLDSIKTRMLEAGEYGEFFPMSFAPYPYNSSISQINFPMAEDEAKDQGLFWHNEKEADIKQVKTISSNELPDHISDVDEEICDFAIIGEVSKKPYKITSREIIFYKQNQISLPVDTPYQRIIDRFKVMDNFRVYNENCSSCNKAIESSHKKSEGYNPVCEQCYQRDIL